MIIRAAMYDGITRGNAARIIHDFRPGMSVRFVSHAVVVPRESAVTVTATVSATVEANSAANRSIGIVVPVPLETTCHARLIGGISAGARTIAVAVHHPRLDRLRPPGGGVVSTGAVIGPAVKSGPLDQTGLGDETGGVIEHIGQV